MITKSYTGTFNIEALMGAVFTAIPGLVYSVVGPEGQLERQTDVVVNVYGENPNKTIEFILPEDTDTTVVDAVVAAHDPDALTVPQEDSLWEEEARTSFRNLPDWATWRPNEAYNNVTSMVLNGYTKQQASDWINTNVTNIATAKTAMIALAHAIIDLRMILANVAKMMMYLRDIIIQRTR